jgi:4-amino-4-deoxy-L-arabinose transferase-like glycosyltransferase
MTKRHVSIVLLILILLLIATIIFLSLVPPTAKDELVHHLAVPKLYLKHGNMYEIPFMVFSYYPMNLQLLYLIPLYFGNDIAPKFMHFSFAILTAYLIFVYLRRRLGKSYALFGALFFLSIPIVVKLSISAYVDLAVIFFTFASLFFILRWIESGFRMRFLVYSAIMCGLGLGTKYTVLITLLLFTLLIPFAYSRYRKESKLFFFHAAAQGLIFLFISLLIFSPWMARNYQWKKNPIYPLYEHRFNPQKRSASAEQQDQNQSINSGLGVFVIREGIYQEKWWEIALVPVRIFFEGEDGSPKHFDGKLNPFLLLFALFALWRVRDEQEGVKNEKKVMLAFVFLFFAIAFFTSDFRVRYIAPIIPAMVILSILGVVRIHKTIGKMRNPGGKGIAFVLLMVALGLALAYNGRYVVAQFKEVEPMAYLTGVVSRDEYLERHRPEYAAMRFINNHLPQDAKVMLIFLGSRGYYCDREYIYGDEALGSVFLGSDTAEEMHLNLKGMGITHLLIYDPLFARWITDNLRERMERSLKAFFLNYAKVLYSQNGFSLLALENVSS